MATVLAVGTFAVAASLALVVVTSRGGPSIADPAPAEAVSPARPAEPLPLELVALSHDRAGDQITVRGIVRNPRDSTSLDQVTAVVYLFDRDGGFLGDGTAAIETSTLAPGAESAFVVSSDHAANIGRYRVSFKTGDRVVPHLDRRLSILDPQK